MGNGLSKEEISHWNLMNKKHQALVDQLIPIIADHDFEGSYVSRLVKHNFSMFKEEGKAVVVTYDFNDLPIPHAFRAIVAADPLNSVKYDYRFGGEDEYTLYRRNFIDLKLAQEVATQYLREGTRSDKVLWDEFLW